MHTENTVYMKGDPARIFSLAANIQDWPLLLPHYRDVQILEQTEDGRRKEVIMHAVRDDFPIRGLNFPVRWRSVQVCEPNQQRIYFKHLAGIATGMWVVWSLEQDSWGRGVRVRIDHELRYPFQALNGWFSQDLVGKGFVQAIAGRTLKTIKSIVESERSL